MTSGRIPCPDCGRGSPQGRHAACHVLALLKSARERGRSGTGRGFLVPSDWLSGEVFGTEDYDPYHARLHGAIRLLRQQGHDISTIGGGAFGCSYRLNQEATP